MVPRRRAPKWPDTPFDSVPAATAAVFWAKNPWDGGGVLRGGVRGETGSLGFLARRLTTVHDLNVATALAAPPEPPVDGWAMSLPPPDPVEDVHVTITAPRPGPLALAAAA
jgi:hypothetical protein